METTKKSKYSIVNAVCLLLNLGDFAKVENFVAKTVKVLEREIDGLKRNQSASEYNQKTRLSELAEKLEDAQQSVEETYVNIDVNKLKTNEEQNIFREKYLESITQAELKVKAIQDQIEKYKETCKDDAKSLVFEIELREARIKKLSKG